MANELFQMEVLCRVVDALGVDREFYPSPDQLGEQVPPERVLEAWASLPEGRAPLGAYVHLPFCRSKCAYCHFPSHVPAPSEVDAYIELLAVELALFEGALRRLRFDTLYIGGGTPSLLSADQLHRVLDAVFWGMTFSRSAQITVEANPSTISRNFAEALSLRGVDRVSLGVQSLDPVVLERVNRGYQTIAAVRAAMERCRAAGITNLCVDLMAGLPGQSQASFLQSVEEVTAMAPDGIHVYPFEAKASELGQAGLCQTREEAARTYHAIAEAESLLEAAGYQKPLNETVYVRSPEMINRYDRDRYLRAGSVASFGDHAYGHVFSRLGYAAVSPARRQRALSKGALPPYVACAGTLDSEMREYMAYNLKHDIVLGRFEEMFQRDAREVFTPQLAALKQAGLITISDHKIQARFGSQQEAVAAGMVFFPREILGELIRRLEE